MKQTYGESIFIGTRGDATAGDRGGVGRDHGYFTAAPKGCFAKNTEDAEFN